MSLRKTRRRQNLEDISVIVEDEPGPLEIMYQKIKAPIVWDTWPPCYVIQDMQENYYDDAINLTKVSSTKSAI